MPDNSAEYKELENVYLRWHSHRRPFSGFISELLEREQQAYVAGEVAARKQPGWEDIENFEQKVNIAARLNELNRLENLEVSHNDAVSVVVAYAAYLKMRKDELRSERLEELREEEGE